MSLIIIEQQAEARRVTNPAVPPSTDVCVNIPLDVYRGKHLLLHSIILRDRISSSDLKLDCQELRSAYDNDQELVKLEKEREADVGRGCMDLVAICACITCCIPLCCYACFRLDKIEDRDREIARSKKKHFAGWLSAFNEKYKDRNIKVLYRESITNDVVVCWLAIEMGKRPLQQPPPPYIELNKTLY